MSHTYTLLALGDSYTIGESVSEQERFASQAIHLLSQKGHHFAPPTIIAKTGWTTDELQQAIKDQHLKGGYDYVTLLIGVNNQYREYPIDQYQREFAELLHTAIDYASGDASHVVVLSIPDWGVTPFATGDPKARSAASIAAAIDQYNAINRSIALAAHAQYIDVTPISRRAATDGALLANDNLHPSAKMYHEWAQLLVKSLLPKGLKK